MFRLGADGGRRGERALSAWRALVHSAPYVAALLRDGLGVPEARVRVGSGREAWTLGAALAEGGRAAPAPHDVQVWVWGRTCAPAWGLPAEARACRQAYADVDKACSPSLWRAND